MWDKIVAGIVAILLIGLAVGALVPSGEGGEGDHSGVTELTLVVKNADKDTSESLTLEIPGTISVTQDFLQSAGILDNPSTFTTISDPDNSWSPDDRIMVHAVADVWWGSYDLESVDRVTFEQQGSSGDWVSNQGNSLIVEETTGDHRLSRTIDQSVEYSPGDEYFSKSGGDRLTADEIDGSYIDADVEIEGTDKNDNSVSDRIHISAQIELDINPDGSLSLGAELTEAETESQ